MTNFIHGFLFILTAVFLSTCSATPDPEPTSGWFKHHTVSTDFSEESRTRFGMPMMADLDNDGDLDFSLCETRGPVFWLEYLGDHQWDKHQISTIPTTQLGGTAYDVDRDGWMDLVAGGYWFRNSQHPREEAFTRIAYDTSITTEIHDMVFKDIDGDEQPDLVVLGDREGCFWYKMPANPLVDTLWEKHTVTLDVLDERSDIHGGLFPGGVGDLDNDGDADIVLPGRWYRNEDRGQSWSRQFLPYGSGGYWGLSGRSWILDLDRDGDQDIVTVSCDQMDSRAAWLENNGRETPGFTVHLLPFEADGRRGSLHALWVADFDLDNDPDIFTIEQEDPTIPPTGATVRAYVWENLDGQGGSFKEHVVLDKQIGGHDIKFGDADGDGDLDAYFKVWSPHPDNAYGGRAHVDYLENLAAGKH